MRNMSFRPRIAKLVRVTRPRGRTLHFIIPGVDRRNLAQVVEPDRVPDFAGKSAWFEMVKVRESSPWPRWTVLRRVEAPA